MQEIALQEGVRECFSLGERMQPMVVLVDELTGVNSAYVVVDETTWQVQTAVKAVDICFKAHTMYYMLDILWSQMPRCYCSVSSTASTKWDAVSSKVTDVLSDLSK
jgi:hypothetical protein